MINIAELDQYYRKCISEIHTLIPDSILNIDLTLLQKLDLLHFQPGQFESSSVTRYFQLIESPDKITLVNDQFIIWIAARKSGEIPFTYTLIALNRHDHPVLEMAFLATGAYNTSHLVMRVLEKLLLEIQETEDVIQKLV